MVELTISLFSQIKSIIACDTSVLIWLSAICYWLNFNYFTAITLEQFVAILAFWANTFITIRYTVWNLFKTSSIHICVSFCTICAQRILSFQTSWSLYFRTRVAIQIKSRCTLNARPFLIQQNTALSHWLLRVLTSFSRNPISWIIFMSTIFTEGTLIWGNVLNTALDIVDSSANSADLYLAFTASLSSSESDTENS